MLKYLYLLTGGALGTLMRYVLSVSFNRELFPAGTFFINVSGSFLIGLLAGISGNNLSPNMKLFLVTGILGGYTTFSGVSLESMQMIQNGRTMTALVYISGSCILGLAGAIAGFYLGNTLNR